MSPFSARRRILGATCHNSDVSSGVRGNLKAVIVERMSERGSRTLMAYSCWFELLSIGNFLRQIPVILVSPENFRKCTITTTTTFTVPISPLHHTENEIWDAETVNVVVVVLCI